MTRREQARVDAGVSLETAAKWANVRERYFRRLELHPELPMTYRMIVRLSKGYKCDPKVFILRKEISQ